MKKCKFLLLFVFMFVLLIPSVSAITIRETMDENDSYSTLEPGSIIIGVTRFSPDRIVTASRAATAGVDDVKLHVLKNGNVDDYKAPGVYYYIDSYVGWFFLDVDNKATPVTDEEELEKLSKLDIYFVDNTEKVLEVDVTEINIDEDSLPNGVKYKNNKLYVNATISEVKVKTEDNKEVRFSIDPTTSQFVEEKIECYTVKDGIITAYDSGCGNEVVIPVEYNGEKITGIGVDAFKGSSLVNVIIPNTINSIGSNAFADNKLESVIIKDKYDESNFSFYGDNVFGDFKNVIYDNELTRILNYVDNDYVLNYYDSFDIEILLSELKLEYGLKDYLSYSLIDKFENNGYGKNFESCYYKCNFEDRYVNGDEIALRDVYGVELIYTDGYKYNLKIEKYDVSENKVYSASKVMNVELKKSGIKEDYNTVLEAIDNLEFDYRYYDKSETGDRFVTRKKYLDDLEDLYDLDLVVTSVACGTGIQVSKEIHHSALCKTVYYLKNGVLYSTNDVLLFGIENKYEPSLYLEDYENIDLYVEELLKEFSKDTGVDNYYANLNDDGKIYGKSEQNYETGIVYKIELIDNEFSENWLVEFIDYYDDQYDDNGNTKSECFEFEDGAITGYNGKCGANVRFPDEINGVAVTKISGPEHSNGAFYDYAIRSIVFPNTLKLIGYGAFERNRISEVVIPDSVEHIGSSAFANNRLSNITIPSSVKTIGDSAFYYNLLTDVSIPDNVTDVGNYAFSYNQIETVKIGSGLDRINERVFTDNKIKKLEIPSNIKVINDLAFHKNKIEELILNEGLEKIGSQSFANNLIKSLKLPKSLQIIGSGAVNDNLLSDDEAFIYDRKYVQESGKYIVDNEKLVSYGGANRDKIVVPNNVKHIGDYGLHGLNANEIVLPYGLESIGNAAFSYNNLTNMTIPDTVKTIGESVFEYNSFDDNNRFIYVTDKNGNVDKSILAGFGSKYSYYQFEEIVIPSSVKKIFANAFSMGHVENLVIPYGVLEIGDNAFANVSIDNVITLPMSINKLGKNIFSTNYNIDENDGFIYGRNEDGTIDKSILMGYMGNIQDGDLTIPEGIIEIRENVFNYWITDVKLPSTLEKIGAGSFEGTYLRELIIPKNVKYIGDNAFAINSGLSSVMVLGKASSNEFEYLGNNAFGTFNKVKYENRVEVDNITLNNTVLNLFIGDMETLIAVINPSNATDKNIVWSSTNSSVAIVDSNGKVTAVGEGSTYITASVGGKSVSCLVIVEEKITYDYQWEQISSSVVDEYYLYIVDNKGNKVSGRVNIKYNNDKNKEFNVSNEGIKIVKSAVSSVEILSID